MYKTINGIQYNVDAISQMTFEEFRSTCTDWSENKAKNIYETVTGKKVVKEKKKKAVEEVN